MYKDRLNLQLDELAVFRHSDGPHYCLEFLENPILNLAGNRNFQCPKLRLMGVPFVERTDVV